MPYLWTMPDRTRKDAPPRSRIAPALLGLMLGLSGCSTQKLILEPRKAPVWIPQQGLAPCWTRTAPIELNLPEFPQSYEVPNDLTWRFNLGYRTRNPLLAPGLQLETSLAYDACRTDSARPYLELTLLRKVLDSTFRLDSLRIPIARERSSDLVALLDAMRGQRTSSHERALRLVGVNDIALAPWARKLAADFQKAKDLGPESRFQKSDSTWQWLRERAWSDPTLRHALTLRLFLGKDCRGCFAIEDTLVLDQDSLRLSRPGRQP